MTAKRNLNGERFGRLVAFKEGPKSGKKTRWICICDCGNNAIVNTSNLTGGHTLSCGCITKELQSKRAIERNTVHGHNTVAVKSSTWMSWHAMKCRCMQPKHPSYPEYGGRGITVCDRWKGSFLNFLEDMGDRPESLTIERIDVNGNYEAGNCRWATLSEQQHNRQDNWWKWVANDNGGWTRVAA